MNKKKTKKNIKQNNKVVQLSSKWPIKKFINKFWIYNIFTLLGITMLLLSILCKNVFIDDKNKYISNIAFSAIILAAGILGNIIYSVLLINKNVNCLCKQWAQYCSYCSWIPIIGLVFGIIWRRKEKYSLWQQCKAKDPSCQKPKLQLPNSISIIFCALIVIVFVIWILYLSGILVKDATNTIPGILDIFLNPLRGFAGYNHLVQKSIDGINKTILERVNGVGAIVIFLLVFNGTMTLVNDSHAIEAGIGSLLKKMHGKEIILLPILMFVLSICGSTFNMCEQLLPLFMVIIPIFFAAGYDRMTGFLVVFMSAGVGVMASTINPVLIGTGISAMQDVADLNHVTIMTGIVWRLIIFVVLTAACIIMTMLYANKVRKNPTKSCVYMSKQNFAQTYSFDQDALPLMTKKHVWTLLVFSIAFLMLIVGFIDWQTLTGFTGFSYLSNQFSNYCPFISSMGEIGRWGMVEPAMLFLIAALIIGAINWKSANHWFNTFYAGCREFIGVAFIVAVAKGLAITLTDSGFNGMIANGIAPGLKTVGNVGTILIIFLVISFLTIFIPSSSGLSSAMFPVIGPAVASANGALLSGSVTSFAAAMGWVNLFTPTGMILPFLEVAKMDMTSFVKVSWKQIFVLLLLGIALLAIGTYLPKGMF